MPRHVCHECAQLQLLAKMPPVHLARRHVQGMERQDVDKNVCLRSPNQRRPRQLRRPCTTSTTGEQA
eukprot:scaffold93601_cov32-Tisochrysis_lutea.AAC.3